MVKARPLFAIDVMLGVLAVLFHPSADQTVKAVLLLYVGLCIVRPTPIFRFLFLLLGTGGLQVLAALGLGPGFYPETDFAAFLLAGILWAVLPSGFPRQRRGAAYIVGLGALGFAAVSLGYLFLWLLDRLVLPLGRLFFLELSNIYRGLHLGAVGAVAIVVFLALWSLVTTWTRRGRGKSLIYADGYLACRRQLSALSKRWQC